MKGRLPDAILAGVPKAGTSALARGLGARDDVHLPPDKEVHFFDDHRDRGIDWYRAQFPVDESIVALDATPTYALDDDLVEDMARVVPDARVILVLRSPVDRFWSSYWYLRSLGKEPRSMQTLVTEELHGRPRLPYDIIATGDYPRVLRRVQAWFPPERLLVVLHDDLRDDPDAVYRETCEFLGLDPGTHPHQVGTPQNVTGTLRSYHLRYWTMRLHLFRRLPSLATRLDRWNRTDRRPPPLTSAERAFLVDLYRPSVDELETMLDRDLSGWRR